MPQIHKTSKEPFVPQLIGEGRFASVFSIPTRLVVAKVAKSPDARAQILQEFYSCDSVYTQCNEDSLFSIPRPFVFYDPQTQDIIHTPSSKQYQYRPGFFTGLPGNPCYIMHRVAPLPHFVGCEIRKLFYPKIESDDSKELKLTVNDVPQMCRLFFGEDSRSTQRVFSPTIFPIDVSRYRRLAESFSNEFTCPLQWPSAESLVSGMGEMLSCIHWKAGYDARDIEFVMAGCCIGAHVLFHLIDFDQMRAFDVAKGDVAELVDSFVQSDPYYPRPGDPLYEMFKKTYTEFCPIDLVPRAESFLTALESHYAEHEFKA